MSETIIACLCAGWCQLCDTYRPILQEVCAEVAGAGVALRLRWIDIEDEADLVGDFDVETFPTLVIIDARHVRFAGPVTPEAATLRRLLRATVAEAAADARWPAVAPEVKDFAARLRLAPRG